MKYTVENLLFVCLFCIGLFSNGVHSLAGLWTKEKCKDAFRSVETIKDFRNYASKLVQGAVEFQDGLLMTQDVKIDKATLDRCMHSADGLGELRKLKEIVDSLPTVNSVCQADFAEKLIDYDRKFEAQQGSLFHQSSKA